MALEAGPLLDYGARMDASQLERATREGNVSVLYEYAHQQPIDGYAWLLIALDLGHEGAEDALGDVYEHTDAFRYDDEHSVPLAHLEAARRYFVGPFAGDFEQGAMHLDEFLMGTFDSVEDADRVQREAVDEIAQGLRAEDAKRLSAFFSEAPFRRVPWLCDRLLRLKTLGAPTVVCRSQLEALKRAVEALDEQL